MKIKNMSAAILAGGENKRFDGIIKSNIVIGESTILKRILDTISGLFDEIIIVTNTPEEFNICPSCIFVRDHFLKVGPLGGIHSAMKVSSKKSIFVFAGDMPLLDKGLIISQIEYFSKCTPDVLIPRIKGFGEPLHAIYSNSILAPLEEYLASEKKYAIKDFLLNVKVKYMELSDSEKTRRAFTNINTPEEAEKISSLKKTNL